MNTADAAVVYNFPEKIIERQSWINFLTRYHEGLMAWYIDCRTGRLFGVYEGNDSLWWAAFKFSGDSAIFDASHTYPDDDKFWLDMKHSPASGVTRFMGKYVGIYKNDPAKPEGKVIALPGCTVPPDMIRKTETPREKREKEHKPPRVFIARPGEAVPHGIPDLRGKLQRPGLILLAYARGRREFSYYGKKWDATYWLAWWVSTSGPIRYYASDYGFLDSDIPEMRPDASSRSRNCLAGDKWSGGAWVSYVVNTAPECVGLDMHPDPDPRIAHIEALKSQGYTVDYSLEYKMSEEKAKFAAIKRERKKRAELWKAKALFPLPKEM
ncbi:hypothetical protein FACS189450_13110 [Spirochaetia bacterium]|nr:hypothetical protein FACS189450_13110 [Spirochaetia bacterium]